MAPPIIDVPLWLWGAFAGAIIALLVLDLGVLHRKPREMKVKESLVFSLFYLSVGLAFGVAVWHLLGAEAGTLYLTAYVVEKSLSLDNIFVISMIFAYFQVPVLYQHRVLFWGILGVVILRGIAIALGSAILAHFAWALYFFAALLIYTGGKILLGKDNSEPDLENNRTIRFLNKYMLVTRHIRSAAFFVRAPHPEDMGRMAWWATPLFVALVMVEIADLIFAADSIPAVFAITHEPFIVYTSNIFAILGLRALYFLLAAIIHRFAMLKYAIALVLIFIGIKVFYNGFFGHIAPSTSLAVTVIVLALGVVVSMLMPSRHTPHKAAKHG